MFDRWEVYETLKGNKKIDIKEIEDANANEIKEGLIEFLLMKSKDIEEEKEFKLINDNKQFYLLKGDE